MNEISIQNMLDEMAIRELLTRYSRAIDRCDIDLLKSTYWPDATDDHGVVFIGNAMDFSNFVIPMLKERLECTMHMIGNMWLKLDGDKANCETYSYTYHRLKSTDAKIEVTIGGRYLDRLERRNGEWRIAMRKFVVDWEQNGAAIFGGEDNVQKLLSVDTRHRGDHSYSLFAGKKIT
jgi:hypothetical protein